MCSWQHWMLSQEKNDFMSEWTITSGAGTYCSVKAHLTTELKTESGEQPQLFADILECFASSAYSCSSKSATWVQWHLFSLQTIAEHTSRQDKNLKAQFPMQMSLVMLLWELLVCRKHFYPLIFWIKKPQWKQFFFWHGCGAGFTVNLESN